MIAPNIYEELKKFRDGPIRRSDGPTKIIRYLTEQGFIKAIEHDVLIDKDDVVSCFSVIPIEWEITVKGLVALSEFEEKRQKAANDERQRRFQNKISVLNVLIPLVTFFLGLVIEHFAGLLDFLTSFFHV